MEMKIKLRLILGACLLAMAFTQSVKAQDAPISATAPVTLETMREQAKASGVEPSETQMVVLADINFRSPILVYQDNNKLSLFFQLENNLSQSEAGIRYGVQLVKDKTVFDELVYTDDVLSVEGNKTIDRIFEYSAPSYLSGDFELWLVAKNESGLPLALFKFEKPLTLNGTNQHLVIDQKTCQLKVAGDTEAKSYSLLQGVSLKPEEALTLSCEVTSTFSGVVTATPTFNTYERTLFGNLIDKNKKGIAMTFRPGEKTPIELTIEKPTVPQAYEVKLDFVSDGQSASSPIIFHYVIAGESATIQKLDLDKMGYEKGETINATLLWSGSADNFPNSRTGKTENAKVLLSLEISDQANQKCADTLENTLAPDSREAKLALVAKTKCTDPKIKVTLKNEQGTVLAQKEFNFLKVDETIQKGPSVFDAKAKVLAIALVLILLAILIFFIIKRKNRVDYTTALPLIVLALFGLSFGRVEALTLSLDPGWSSNSFSINLDKPSSSYAPNENITATASGTYAESCNNISNYMNLSGTLSGSCGGTIISADSTDDYLNGSKTCTTPGVAGSYNASFTDELFGECTSTFVKYVSSCAGYPSFSGDYCANLGSEYCSVQCYLIEEGQCVDPTYYVSKNVRNYIQATGNISYTVAAPTATMPTGDIYFDARIYNVGDNPRVTWTTAHTSSAKISCTGAGIEPITNLAVLVNGSRQVGPVTKTGIISCGLTATNDGSVASISSSFLAWAGLGAPASADIVSSVNSFTAAATIQTNCTGTGPDGVSTIMCPGDDDPLLGLSWVNVVNFASCSLRKCQYYTPSGASVVNGACGTASGVATCAAPTTNLCSAGSASIVTDYGATWGWNCVGSGGGSTANCSATKNCGLSCTDSIPIGYTKCFGDDTDLVTSLPWQAASVLTGCSDARKCEYYPTPTDAGTCGAADGHVFAATDTGLFTNVGWGIYNLCDTGDVRPSGGVSFPEPGTPTLWQCKKDNFSPQCSATKLAALNTPGVCGTADRTYGPSENFPGSGTLCTSGVASPASPSLSTSNLAATSVSWTCIGTNGVNDNCTATRACVPSAASCDCTVAVCAQSDCGTTLHPACLNSCGTQTGTCDQPCLPCNSGNWTEVNN